MITCSSEDTDSNYEVVTWLFCVLVPGQFNCCAALLHWSILGLLGKTNHAEIV